MPRERSSSLLSKWPKPSCQHPGNTWKQRAGFLSFSCVDVHLSPSHPPPPLFWRISLQDAAGAITVLCVRREKALLLKETFSRSCDPAVFLPCSFLSSEALGFPGSRAAESSAEEVTLLPGFPHGQLGLHFPGSAPRVIISPASQPPALCHPCFSLFFLFL